MSLSDDYLRYPRRRLGMDHDRYDWSILFRRRPLRWPGDARVALWVVPQLEWFPLDMTGSPVRPPGALERPYPDYRYYTHRDYGLRVGIYRIIKLLDKHGIKASVAINSALAERHPLLLDEVVRRGWEVIAHGVDMDKIHYGGLDRETEAQQVREAVTTLRRLTGQPVKGWLSPAKSESENTLDLLAEAGINYVCDWCNDDLPYPMHVAGGTLHSMPHAHEIDDRLIIMQYHHDEQAFLDQITDQFDVLYREAESHGGRIVAITLNPWVIGQPYRIAYLDRAFAHILSHEGVWCATGAEILEAFKAQD